MNRPELYQEVRGELPEGCHDLVDPAEILEYLGRTEGGGKVFIIHREED